MPSLRRCTLAWPQSAIVESRFKLLAQGTSRWLFDLPVDRLERVDVSAQWPAERTRLEALLRAWGATGPASTGTAVPMDAEALQRMRSLGYIR